MIESRLIGQRATVKAQGNSVFSEGTVVIISAVEGDRATVVGNVQGVHVVNTIGVGQLDLPQTEPENDVKPKRKKRGKRKSAKADGEGDSGSESRQEGDSSVDSEESVRGEPTE